MTTPKDPAFVTLSATVARLESIVAALHLRIRNLETQNKKLRGSIGRTNDQLGTVARQGGAGRRLPKA